MLRRVRVIVLALAVVAGAGLFASLEKGVTLVVNGRTERVGTLSMSVGQLLSRRGIDLGPHDSVTPHPGTRLREGTRIEVRLAPVVTVVAGGTVREVPVPEDTPSIREVLARASIPVDADDVVTPGLDLVPHGGMTVRITKVVEREVSAVERVAHATRVRYDPTMKVGTSRIEAEGHDGFELVTYRSRSEDGLEVVRDVLHTRMFERPRDEYVVVGTDARERIATWQRGEASWYERDGIGAAHRWLPKGTRVTVTNLDTGASITLIIDDRGPYGVAGRVIDLTQEAFARLAPLGQGVFPVEITW